MNFFKNIAFIIIGALTLNACTFHNGKYAAVSDKPITLYTLVGKKWRVRDNLTSRDSKHSFLYVTADKKPTIEKAVSRILDENMGDYLANVDIKYTGFHILWIYHYEEWEVKGDVIRVYQ